MPLRFRSTSLVLALTVAACSQPVLSKTNDEPVVVIQQPGEGAVFPEGQTIDFVGRVSDDGDLSTVSVTWLDNGATVLLADQNPDADGYVTLSTADLDPGPHAITVRAVDVENLSGDASVTITIEDVVDRPNIQVIAPTSGTSVEEEQEVLFEAEVSDGQDAPEDLQVEISSDQDGFLCVAQPDELGAASCRGSLTTVGDHRITYTVFDTDQNTASRSIVLSVDAVRQDPLVAFVAPTSGLSLRQGTLTVFDLTVSDRQDDPTDLLVTLTSDRDSTVCTPVVSSNGTATCFGALTTFGAHALTAVATDTDGNEGRATIVVQVADGLDIDDDGDGQTENQGDCDDANIAVFDGATEQPNGRDDDCDGIEDEGTTLFDDDGDGYCESAVQPCTDGSLGGDCNDAVATVNPGAAEVCNNGYDDNCVNGETEIGALGCTTYWLDADRDTFGLAGTERCTCSPQGNHTSQNDDDCDDSLPLVNPAQSEVPNGRDDNCNGIRDEGTSLYDDDGDGYCDSTTQACTDGSQNGDCDDGNASVNPGRQEICNNNVDDNCFGGQNEPGALGCINWWTDADMDGYGDPTTAACSCTPPPNAVFNGNDCNDAAFSVHAGAPESADLVDNDCDGQVDEGTVNYDNDGDGYCAAATCAPQPNGPQFLGGDCDDNNPARRPGAREVCDNNIDEDCNNIPDDGLDGINCRNWYRDNDNDGYGGGTPVCACSAVGQYDAQLAGDCYDSNNQAYPGSQTFRDVHRGDGSFDYDCNGLEDLRWPDEAECACTWRFGPFPIPLQSFEEGWADGVPDCGDPAESYWTFCEYLEISDGTFGVCFPIGPATGTAVMRTQRCR